MKSYGLLAGTALAVLAMPTAAAAQDNGAQADAGIADIVVTATRREQRLQ